MLPVTAKHAACRILYLWWAFQEVSIVSDAGDDSVSQRDPLRHDGLRARLSQREAGEILGAPITFAEPSALGAINRAVWR